MSMHNTGVTITSKLLIRGISPTAMGARPGRGSEQNHGLTLFRTSLQMDTCPAGGGFPMSYSQSWRREFRWTRSSFLAPSRDARHRWRRCIAACPPRRWESARGPFPSATARRGRGVALRVFGRKAGCGSYPKGRRCIVPNVHGPRLARRLPAEHGASKTHAVYPGVCGTVWSASCSVARGFRCTGASFDPQQADEPLDGFKGCSVARPSLWFIPEGARVHRSRCLGSPRGQERAGT
jgi:hypothetical protein